MLSETNEIIDHGMGKGVRAEGCCQGGIKIPVFAWGPPGIEREFSKYSKSFF